MALFSKKLGIDLGTVNTLVYLPGKGIVLNEPTIVAVGIEDRKVLAVGNEAKKMLGKTPEYIEVIQPLEDGVIADYEVTEAMLRYFLKQVMGNNWFIGPEVMVCIPAGVTQVEQRAVMDAVLSAGARKAHLIDEPLAAAISLTALVPKPKLVKLPMIPIVEVSKPIIPIPAGPNHTATNFDRIILIMILKTCTPPKMEVAFMI